MTPNPIESAAAKASVAPATGDLEVRPAKPLQLDTPEQIIERLRKELAGAHEASAGLVQRLEAVQEDRDWHDRRACKAVETLAWMEKRVDNLVSDRDHQKVRAEKAEAAVDAQRAERVVALIRERDGLRREIRVKDICIADLKGQLDAAQAQAGASRTLAQKAEQRAQGFEATVEAMQAARDAAQRERDAAERDRRQVLARANQAEDKVKELEAAAKAKPAAPAPARKGA